ncbi:MAG: DUF4922 domain-containing protein [Bacteroidota bacterium]
MPGKNIQQEVFTLFTQQSREWPLLAENMEGLKSVKIRRFKFDGFSMNAQFNPKRIVSSAARVDPLTIRNRPCFLCRENRPPEQKGVDMGNGYSVLCNPYPIFHRHFTIVRESHVLQRIRGEFGNFLAISESLPDLAVFYNGPRCGASAPDHMHFQAGNKGLMPVEEETKHLLETFGAMLLSGGNTKVWAVDDHLRRFLYIESGSAGELEAIFDFVYEIADSFSADDEPMMNLLSYYSGGWKLYIFLRAKHRPRQYFLEGEDQILLSPASVDYGGTLIFPLEKDFNRVEKEDILDMLSQVSISEKDFDTVTDSLRNYKI